MIEQRLCLVCRERTVERFLSLGTMTLANKFVTSTELAHPPARYPLQVGVCRTCTHVQLVDAVPPPAMFDDYLYMSSASQTLTGHLQDLANIVVDRFGLGAGDLVVDIGCNDGTLLGFLRERGVRTLGVDPAQNLAALRASSGIDRMVTYFTRDTAAQIVARCGQASVVTITNTFPHIQDLQEFTDAVKVVLKPGGALVIEAHYLMDLLDQGAFDTVYHEHVSYWSLAPMQRLFAQAGLEVVDAEHLALHHGQIRAVVRRQGEAAPLPSVARLLAEEEARGLRDIATYHRFAAQVERIRDDLRQTLERLRLQQKRVVAYGAPAKGNTLIEFLGLNGETLEYIVDKSALKQGRFSPGSHIPVVPTERLLEDQPDYVVLLAWNFREEILEQQAEYRRRGGKFIAPLPQVQVL